MNSWFLLDQEPLDGALNMAVDHYLLNQLEQAGLDRPVLRLYQWSRPTLSLGYHQRWQRAVDLEAAKRLGTDVVRRLTGGRAVLHDRELTYSLVAPTSHPFSQSIADNYRTIGHALARFSQSIAPHTHAAGAQPQNRDLVRGALPCFASISDQEIQEGTRKLIGSSQKVGRGAFLQHGSIPLFDHAAQLQELTRTSLNMREYMATLEDLYQQQEQSMPTITTLKQAFASAFEASFEVQMKPLEIALDTEEINLLVESKYGNNEWTFRR